MKLIVGLGNPGSKYEQTRHNVGFHVLDLFAKQQGWSWSEQRSRAMLASGTFGSEKVVLAKPLTYMNNSGESVVPLMHWYKIQPEDVLIVFDDLDLPVGKVRLKSSGSAGGHNGLDNIIRHLHTQNVSRLRVGIGRPAHNRMGNIDYVLGIPPTDERILLTAGEERAADAIPLILRQGVAIAMNAINADPEAQREAEEKQRLRREKREQERVRREEERRTRAEQFEETVRAEQVVPSQEEQ